MKRVFMLAIAMVMLFMVNSYASNDVVVVSLNNPQDVANKTKIIPKRIMSGPTNRTKPPVPNANEKIKLGNYAVVRADISRMHASPNVNSSVRGVLSFGETVIVKKEISDFYGIILEDGISIGWVEKIDLKKSDTIVWTKGNNNKANKKVVIKKNKAKQVNVYKQPILPKRKPINSNDGNCFTNISSKKDTENMITFIKGSHGNALDRGKAEQPVLGKMKAVKVVPNDIIKDQPPDMNVEKMFNDISPSVDRNKNQQPVVADK